MNERGLLCSRRHDAVHNAGGWTQEPDVRSLMGLRFNQYAAWGTQSHPADFALPSQASQARSLSDHRVQHTEPLYIREAHSLGPWQSAGNWACCHVQGTHHSHDPTMPGSDVGVACNRASGIHSFPDSFPKSWHPSVVCALIMTMCTEDAPVPQRPAAGLQCWGGLPRGSRHPQLHEQLPPSRAAAAPGQQAQPLRMKA